MGRDAAGRRIIKFLTDRYFLSKAGNNWRDLADKYNRKKNGDSIWEIQKKLKEYLIFKDVMNDLNDKIKKDGLEQLKKGNNWLIILENLRKILREQDNRNNDKIKRRYLRKWIDKGK